MRSCFISPADFHSRKPFSSYFKTHCLVLIIIAGVCFSSPVFADEALKKEINWIGTLPQVKLMTTNDSGSSIAQTYSVGADENKTFDSLVSKLTSKGWSVKQNTKTSTGTLSAYTLSATKLKMVLQATLSKTGFVSSVLSIDLSYAGSLPGKGQSGGENTPETAPANSDYKELSGSVMSTLTGNFRVPEGEELNLMGRLNGNLYVSKGATANISGTVNGNIVNYGSTQIMGRVEGSVTNYGGTVNALGKVKGGVINK